MAFSLLTETYMGGPQVYTLAFALDYLERSDIKVNVLGDLDAMGNLRDYAFTFNSANEITVTEPIRMNSTVRISRTVNKRELPVDFRASGTATREALRTTARYMIMAVHEALDGRLDGSVDNVEEVAEQVRSARTQAAASATAAASSATAAAASESTVSASATAAATSATAAATSETNAAASATTATSGLSSITATGNAAAASASSAATSSTNAAASETAASVSAGSAGTQASAAAASATAAQTSATAAAASSALVPGAASQAQATAGTNNTTYMTPLRTQQAIAANPTGWTTSADQTLTVGGFTSLFNGIPAGVNEVRVILTEMLAPDRGRFRIFLGSGNAISTTGYTTRWWRSNGGNAGSGSTAQTTGFLAGAGEGNLITGTLTLIRIGSANTWQGDLQGMASQGAFTAYGRVILPGPITSIAFRPESAGTTLRAGGTFTVAWRT